MMRALHLGLRVTDLDRSTAFYRAVGYEVIAEVPETPIGHLLMLKLSGDPFVTLELVHHPGYAPSDADSPLSHLVIQVDDLAATGTRLAERGIDIDEPSSPDGTPGFWTAMLTDPDGNRIELVQWPPGHADGITAADQA
jgi:lactoylglutathione lyase